MIKHCEICGREFVAKRSDARYCSTTCRSRKTRGGAFIGTIETPKPAATMSESEVVSIIDKAHCTAADLSRASMYTTAPMSVKLRNVARKLEGALRGEGL